MTSTLTRNTLHFVGLAILVSAVSATTALAGQVAKFKGNGAYISVWGHDASGCLWFSLYVSKGGTKLAPQTWMYYDLYNMCTNDWIAYGSGLISTSTLKVTSKGATLTVTPSAGANFYAEGATGSISLTLTADGISSYSFSGHSRSEYRGHEYKWHGSWSSQSAMATGSILGFALQNVYGYFGEGRDKYMEIDRGSN